VCVLNLRLIKIITALMMNMNRISLIDAYTYTIICLDVSSATVTHI